MAKASDGGRAGIRDVAALAGVSASTVSRILNGSYPKAPRTRERVLRAVRELDYVADPHARALTTRAGTGTLAMAVPYLDDGFFTSLVQAVATHASAAERLCLIATTSGVPERELDVLRQLLAQRVEAIIVLGSVVETAGYRRGMDAFARSLAPTGTRLVLCARPPIAADAPGAVVEYDNVGGSYAATTHALSRGHRRVLLLAGPRGLSITTRRTEGYRKAVADFGQTPDPALERFGASTRETGHARMREALSEGPPFTAVLAHNDMAAAGAIQALRDAGLRVPEDVSVIGFDDAAFAADLRLTTVHIPTSDLGRTAVELATNPDDPRRHVMLGTHLVVRESVGLPAPPQGA